MTYPPPAPGGPAAWGPPPAGFGRPVGTNPLAIASLVLGIVGVILFGLGQIVGLVLGLVALSQIKRTGQNGRGLAIAGITLSSLWIVGFVVVVAFGVVGGLGAANDPAGRQKLVSSLRAGDCVSVPDGTTTARTVPSVDCTVPHTGEVYATFDLPRGPFPGDEGVLAQARQECSPRLSDYAPTAAFDAQVTTLIVVPRSGDWATGDRAVVCIAETVAPRTGSIKGK